MHALITVAFGHTLFGGQEKGVGSLDKKREWLADLPWI